MPPRNVGPPRNPGCPNNCTVDTLPRGLCSTCKPNRRRILTRLRARKHRKPRFILTTEQTIHAATALSRLTDWQNTVTDRLHADGKRPAAEIQAAFDDLSTLRTLLRPHLELLDEERIETRRTQLAKGP